MRESSLFRNTWLNLLGQGIPLALAFVVMPWLLHSVGQARMGVLTTLWVVIGYFGLLDLGLGRAVVHMVAERIARGRSDEVPDYIWPALMIIGSLSVIGGIVIAAFSPHLVSLLVNVPDSILAETEAAFFVVSLSLPFVTLTSCLRGVLEAKQEFFGANILQSLTSGANVLAPVMTVLFTPDLSVLAWGLFVARIFLLIAHFVMALRAVPELKKRPRFSRAMLKRLLHFGTWSTVSNIVSPIMVYIDRLVVGAHVEASAVPIYAIPHEAVIRFLILPAALSRALFPKLSSLTEHEVRHGLYHRVIGIMTLAILPVVGVMIYFAEEGLSWWLGPQVGHQAAPILKILALGYFFNSTAQIPFVHLQSLERPDLTARAHLFELPIYLGLLLWLTLRWGPAGAAVAWTIRVALDGGMLFWMVHRLHSRRRFVSEIWGILAAAGLLLPGLFITGLAPRIFLFVFMILVFAFIAWRFWFDENTRSWIETTLSVTDTKDLPDESNIHPSTHKVAIALATYRPDLELLRKQLGSIREQTFQDWFLIVHDDMSMNVEQLSGVVASEIPANRFRVVGGGARRGAVGNFASTLEFVPDFCDLIAFCDQDDEWAPNKLAELIRAFDDPKVAVAHSDLRVVDRVGAEIHSSCWALERRDTGSLSFGKIITRNPVTGCSMMFRSSLLSDILPVPEQAPASPSFFHDSWVALIALKHGHIIAKSMPLVQYRQHGANMVGAESGGGFISSWQDLRQMAHKSLRAFAARRELETAWLERAGAASESYRPMFTGGRDFGFGILCATLSWAITSSSGYLKIGLQLAFGRFLWDLGFRPRT